MATTKNRRPVASASKRPAAKSKSRGSSKKKQSLVSKVLSGNGRWVVLAGFLLLFGGLGAFLLRDSQAHVYNCGTQRYGSYGTCVKYVQRMFNGVNVRSGMSNLYYGEKLVVDGSFGTKTSTAIKNYQLRRGLTSDGIVGTNTWDDLCRVAMTVKTSSSAGSYPYIADAVAAGVSAGCHTSGYPVVSTTSSIQANARTILNSGVTFSQSGYRQQIKFYADTGQPGRVSGGNGQLCVIHPAMMQGLAYVAQRYKVATSSLNRYCMGSLTSVPCRDTVYRTDGTPSKHCSGKAIDVAAVNGVASTGRNSNDQRLITSFFAGVPSGIAYRLGQVQCGSTPTSLFSGKSVATFRDTCNHIHFEVN